MSREENVVIQDIKISKQTDDTDEIKVEKGSNGKLEDIQIVSKADETKQPNMNDSDDEEEQLLLSKKKSSRNKS
jgi:hypothetical protein